MSSRAPVGDVVWVGRFGSNKMVTIRGGVQTNAVELLGHCALTRGTDVCRINRTGQVYLTDYEVYIS